MASFPATFGTRDHAGHAEPLRMTEVPYQIGQTAICREFSTPPEPACDSTCEPLLDQEGLAYLQKPPFCRYLSPLPDSNRGTASLPWSQPTATVLACLGRLPGRWICYGLPPLATTGLHKGSIFVVHPDDAPRADRHAGTRRFRSRRRRSRIRPTRTGSSRLARRGGSKRCPQCVVVRFRAVALFVLLLVRLWQFEGCCAASAGRVWAAWLADEAVGAVVAVSET